jgi:hypothetical protein
MKKQTIWVKKGYDGGNGHNDLFIFTEPKTTDFRGTVNIISSCNFPVLQGMKYGEVREVEIRIKGRK